MSLNWYGNKDFYDDKPPLNNPITIQCIACNKDFMWRRPLFYKGLLPNCPICNKIMTSK